MAHQTAFATSGKPLEWTGIASGDRISVVQESLYGDLQNRFDALKAEWVKAETERQAMRRALRAAQSSVQT